mmetsp:Transcript_26112/g.62031  ORF Transcript_26112/g.62031 Transcript_26112/m.62031 type:complete len:270 (-) Transcript_26112:578-1387(-)
MKDRTLLLSSATSTAVVPFPPSSIGAGGGGGGGASRSCFFNATFWMVALTYRSWKNWNLSSDVYVGRSSSSSSSSSSSNGRGILFLNSTCHSSYANRAAESYGIATSASLERFNIVEEPGTAVVIPPIASDAASVAVETTFAATSPRFDACDAASFKDLGTFAAKSVGNEGRSSVLSSPTFSAAAFAAFPPRSTAAPAASEKSSDHDVSEALEAVVSVVVVVSVAVGVSVVAVVSTISMSSPTTMSSSTSRSRTMTPRSSSLSSSSSSM